MVVNLQTGGPSNLIFCDLQTDVFFSASRKEVNRFDVSFFVCCQGTKKSHVHHIENEICIEKGWAVEVL